jgi:hypothetical protein
LPEIVDVFLQSCKLSTTPKEEDSSTSSPKVSGFLKKVLGVGFVMTIDGFGDYTKPTYYLDIKRMTLLHYSRIYLVIGLVG